MIPLRRILLFLAIMAAVLLCFSFFFVNFHLAKSVTKTNSENSASRAFAGDIDPSSIDNAVHKIFLHVPNRVGLGERLAWEVRVALRKKDRFKEYLVNGGPGADDHPLLLVDIKADKFSWTPFYAHCTATVRFAYATDTTKLELDRPKETNLSPNETPDKFQLRVYGTVTVDDATSGIITLPAYRRIITAAAADSIVKAVSDAVDATITEAKKKRGENAVK